MCWLWYTCKWFLGHAANIGCNKCKKEFPGIIGENNYSVFNRALWPNRENLTHREECRLIKECTSKGDKQRLELEFGARYSCLLQLSYFDPVRMTIIDPMHNLVLGTTKHMISVWKTHELLNAGWLRVDLGLSVVFLMFESCQRSLQPL